MKSVEDYEKITTILTRLKKKDFTWMDKATKLFVELNKAMSRPLLAFESKQLSQKNLGSFTYLKEMMAIFMLLRSGTYT